MPPMFSSLPPRSHGSGSVGPDVIRPGTFLAQILEFIAVELPRWRDHPERTLALSEPELNAQLNTHLNGAARHTLDLIFFSIEEPDPVVGGRMLDLVAKPLGVSICMETRRYSQFQPLLAIECKRLPTPPAREEREYVVTGPPKTTGGIQRFKLGAYVSNHEQAVMIGYVQAGSAASWRRKIHRWMVDANQIAPIPGAPWANETLEPVPSHHKDGVFRFRSTHTRRASCSPTIRLDHLWIVMSGAPKVSTRPTPARARKNRSAKVARPQSK
jgi:hypothetical protein